MKLAVPMTIALLAAVPIAPLRASEPEPATDLAKVEKALTKWAELKNRCGGDYAYTVRFSSFAGFGHVTTVTVRGNEVVQRDFETFQLRRRAPGEEVTPKTAWSESGKEIGSNKQGAPAKTLDELYGSAKMIAAAKLPAFRKRYVRTDEQGLLTSCFTVDTRIADDAPRSGIMLHSITLEPPRKK